MNVSDSSATATAEQADVGPPLPKESQEAFALLVESAGLDKDQIRTPEDLVAAIGRDKALRQAEAHALEAGMDLLDSPAKKAPSAKRAKQTSKKPVYQSSPIKCKRRTKAEIATIRSAMYDLLEAERPMSVRQVFYRLVSKSVIEKTEKEYQNTVVRQLSVMRRAGDLPFDWLADSTRWMRKPTTHSSMKSMLHRSARMYRQATWEDQAVAVEVWLERIPSLGLFMIRRANGMCR